MSSEHSFEMLVRIELQVYGIFVARVIRIFFVLHGQVIKKVTDF
jgi:hypothetical protein